MESAIQIGNIKFVTLYKFNRNKHEHVKIKSTNLDPCCTETNRGSTFVVYRSFSDGGFFRLAASLSIAPFVFFKGSHYISTSFIHIELQIFLSQKFNEIPEITDSETMRCDYNSFIIDNDDVLAHMTSSRAIESELFKPLQSFRSGECFKRYYNYSNTVSRIFRNSCFIPQDQENYLKTFIDLLRTNPDAELENYIPLRPCDLTDDEIISLKLRNAQKIAKEINGLFSIFSKYFENYLCLVHSKQVGSFEYDTAQKSLFKTNIYINDIKIY